MVYRRQTIYPQPGASICSHKKPYAAARSHRQTKAPIAPDRARPKPPSRPTAPDQRHRARPRQTETPRARPRQTDARPRQTAPDIAPDRARHRARHRARPRQTSRQTAPDIAPDETHKSLKTYNCRSKAPTLRSPYNTDIGTDLTSEGMSVGLLPGPLQHHSQGASRPLCDQPTSIDSLSL